MAAAASSSESDSASSSHDHDAKRRQQPPPDVLPGVSEASLEDRAGCWSTVTLGFLNPLLALGSRRALTQADVGVASRRDDAGAAHRAAAKRWEEAERRNREALRRDPGAPDAAPGMAGTLLRSFGAGRVAFALACYVLQSLLSFVPVLILDRLVSFFERYDADADAEFEIDGVSPWIFVAALGALPLLVGVLNTRHSVVMAHAGVFVRTAASTMLYKKSLSVGNAGRSSTSTGQVVNMMSNDTMQLQRFLQFVGLTLVAPVQIVIALYLIFQQVGNATWVGVGYMFLLAPVNGWVFSVVAKMRREVLKYSDERVKLMNEILTGIRILKFYAWERPFGNEVSRLRQKELEALTKLAYVTAVGFSIILLSTPIVQPIIVFITYVNIQDEPLTAATAFTTVALFNIMRFPFAFMPMGLLQFIQSRISLKRLERYLSLPELTEYVVTDGPGEPGSIKIEDSTFSWIDPDAAPVRPIQDEPKAKKKKKGGDDTSQDDDINSSVHSKATSASQDGPKITLRNLNLDIPAGSLVACVGSVGSGKSSLLSAILGELEPIGAESKVSMPHAGEPRDGFVSYCAQSPWVVNDTVRGNVLFGRAFDRARYDEVLEACALVDDLAVLPAGDMTEIGERGINLSGGQKARVSLARAVYSADARILLLDDPLSAVDAHVGDHLFERAICGSASRGATRILVTHHVRVLSRCDLVIVMDRGRILHRGGYRELVDSGVDFAGAVDISKLKREKEEKPAAAPEVEEVDGKVKDPPIAPTAKKEDPVMSAEGKADLKKKGEKLTSDEERAEGSIDGSAYWMYIRAGGVCLAFLVALIQGLGRASEVMSSFWLAIWADASVEDGPLSDSETTYYLSIYALFGFLGICGLGFRGIFLAMHRLKASKKLHDDLTDSILRAPVAFFDVTPIGRVLNRFAADMDKVDLELTQTISQGVSTSFQVLGAFGAIVAATKGTFLVPLIPLGALYYIIQKWFRKSSTELQRVTSIANSPIFADFSQTLSGTSTIRAYGVQTKFFEHTKSSFNNMNAAYILVQLTGYWLALRLDIIGGLIAFFIGAIAVGTLEYEFIPAGWLGLALSYSIEVTSFLKFGVQMIARLEADMSSVERITYYSEHISSEAPAVTDGDPSEGTWPTEGAVELRNVSMRYRDGPLVLKNLDLTIRGGEKIGVCGRTGSGKSSLMIALFRISEIETDGELLIDGINTREIGTEALRMNLSIIPQDPVMFSNTIRYNLDPFNKHSNDELWEVLEKVRMSEDIAAMPNGLDEMVSEGGENFSQGQRQLLCIARSLLRKPKILVMDEATASIDNETDALIQEMIRVNFADATVLTIAHRLNTIMDSDRILVLDDGRVVEWDTPAALLQKEDGHFKGMVGKSHHND